MYIERTHHIDASEPDKDGLHSYYYEYDLYHFKDSNVCFIARSYVDKPRDAHFLRIEEGGHSRMLVDSDLAHPLFLSAMAYLRAAGKTNLHWLSGRGYGYEVVL